MLKVSFPFSRCCNVFVNGTTIEVEQSFEYFVKLYPYDYMVMTRSYDCQGYLLIASEEGRLLWALNRVPSTISTTELLIIFDGDLSQDSKLFNGSLYRNSNANLVSTSGFWSLSENFLEPRKFERVASYEELRYKNGLADFKGRVLQAAAFYNPPMCFLNKTINKTVDGVEAQVFLANHELGRDGIELQIFMLIAERLNFSWSFRKPSGGFRYGRHVNGTWQGGMIGQLVSKEIDIALSGIWLKEDHNIFANLSAPWGQLQIRFLVPRPRPYTSFWALTRPFTPTVWCCLLLILVLETCYMTFRARLKLTENTKRFRRFSHTCIEMTGRIIGIWVPRKITGAKVPLQFWHAAGVVIVTAYSSSLAARLAGAEYEDRIDSVQQFVEADLTWGRQGPEPIFSDYFDLGDKYQAMLPRRYEHENDSLDRHRKIVNGNYAIIGRVVGGVFFPEDDVDSVDLRNYRVMGDTVSAYYSSFAMQPWLLEQINKMVLWCSESGFTSFHLQDVVRRRTGSSLREVLEEHDKSDETARVLALTPLASGFAMLTVGLIVASLVFCFEIQSAAKCQRRQNLRKTGRIQVRGRISRDAWQKKLKFQSESSR
ncbi:uncharacterized protein LOC110117209 isoform X2 [Athalia rosae]|nr:uncharacterized protein LOC110117209 isoform X2 [Athalia rosae]XP_048514196.1 uncharacterized protein LOC110117209 isoform X2 [Athalia rosae]